jgi:hypothetical protein
MTDFEPIAVEVRAVKAADGKQAVLLQFSHGYLIVRPSGARHLARILREVASEIDGKP